ncbi:MAG: S9 family peptidase [Dokdonella sp.]
MKALLLAVALVACPALAATSGKTITHEDLWLMPRVGAPVLSPDGRMVVFQVIEPAYKKADNQNNLWLVPSDGSSGARRITQNTSSEAGVSWSDDSTRIAFAAKRGEAKDPQIWVLDLAHGGEALKMSAISTGASSPKFSPDGKRLVFSSRVYADAKNDEDNKKLAKEEEYKKYKARVYTGFPIRYWDKWLDERQTHLFVETIGRTEVRDLLAGSALAKSPGFQLAGEDGGATWAPDGKSIVFAASRNRDRAAWSFTHTDLFQVSVDGGEPKRLTGADSLDVADGYSDPQFSRDGRTLVASLEPNSGRSYNANRLVVLDWPSGRERARIELPDARSVGSFAIAPDGREVYITAEDAGQEKLYRAPTSGGAASLLGAPPNGVWTQISVGGTGSPVIVASYESATEPPELVRLDASGKSAKKLTSFATAKAAALSLPPVESFTFTNSRGVPIQSMLVRPPQFDPTKKYPLLVLMHGGPFSQWRDAWVLRWNYHLLAAPGYVVLLTNYVGSTGYGEAFSRKIDGDPLKGPAEDINEAADEAIRKFSFIDATHQCAAGASYGGHLANWLQGTTTRYRCLISHAGMVNLEAQWGTSDGIYGREVGAGGPVWEQGPVWREQNPIRLAANFKTPVLVTAGEKDFRVPINNDLEYWSALQRQRVESRLVVFPDENHWILDGENSRYYYKEVHDWLGRFLKDIPAPAAAR